MNTKKLIKIISVILVLIMALSCFIACENKKGQEDSTKNTPEAVAKAFMDAYCGFDANKMLACYPDFVWKNDQSEKDRLIAGLEEFLNYAKPFKPSYEITEIITPDDEKRAEIYDDFKWYETQFDEFSISNITDIKIATALITTTEYNQQTTDTETLVLIQYNGEWHIFFPYLL